jgi:membrane protease YdiL (CAAX protease family)
VNQKVSRVLDFVTVEPLRIRSILRLVLIVLIALLIYQTHVSHWLDVVFTAVLALYAVAAVALVLTAISIGALLPWTRPMFLNDRYATVSGALVASLVIIPLQTVIPEELAFRGVLHGTLERAWGFRGVAAGGSLLFGLWHIASSFGLTSGNVGFSRVLGGGVAGALAGIGLAVAVTAAAGYVFTWLRRRSGSLIAPIALHWSLNGMGALAAALVWHLS